MTNPTSPSPTGSAYAEDLALALELADRADGVTLHRFNSADLQVQSKPDMTPVSDADISCEEMLREHLGGARHKDAPKTTSAACRCGRRSLLCLSTASPSSVWFLPRRWGGGGTRPKTTVLSGASSILNRTRYRFPRCVNWMVPRCRFPHWQAGKNATSAAISWN